MASTASSSSAVASSQAGPLPSKVGELGYSLPETSSEPSTDSEQPEMPERHPADTPFVAPGASTATLAPPTTTTPNASTPSLGSASTIPPKRTGFWFRLTSRRAPPLLWGLQGKTLFYFLINLLVIAGTVTGWAISISHLNAQNQAATDAPPADASQAQVLQMSGAMFIFVHVAFAMAALIELIFLERMVFQLRAERWRHTHPGQALPRSRGGTGEGGMALAPWNRPPLPTYAAALGIRGTGDVEDSAIAVPPPPAYGNTRGSTLLLASANLLRRVSQLSQVPGSRPVSYRETDVEADGIADAIRARELEITLARLEEGGVPAER